MRGEIVKNSPEIQEALRKRGIEEFDGVMVDPWSAGHYGDEEEGRLLRGLIWSASRDLAAAGPAAKEGQRVADRVTASGLVDDLAGKVDLESLSIVWVP